MAELSHHVHSWSKLILKIQSLTDSNQASPVTKPGMNCRYCSQFFYAFGMKFLTDWSVKAPPCLYWMILTMTGQIYWYFLWTEIFTNQMYWYFLWIDKFREFAVFKNSVFLVAIFEFFFKNFSCMFVNPNNFFQFEL